MGFLTGLQVALFFRDRVDRPDQLATNINKQLDNMFDKIPTVIPVPEDAPVEVPVVMMTSTTLPYQLNFSRKRADLILPHSGPVERGKDQRNQFVEFAKKLSGQMAREVSIIRVGVIAHCYQPVEDVPAYINRKFAKRSIPSNADEVMIHYNIKKDKNKILTNNLITIQEQNFTNSSDVIMKGVYFMFDKNNHISESVIQNSFIRDMIDSIDIYLGKNVIDYISNEGK